MEIDNEDEEDLTSTSPDTPKLVSDKISKLDNSTYEISNNIYSTTGSEICLEEYNIDKNSSEIINDLFIFDNSSSYSSPSTNSDTKFSYINNTELTLNDTFSIDVKNIDITNALNKNGDDSSNESGSLSTLSTISIFSEPENSNNTINDTEVEVEVET